MTSKKARVGRFMQRNTLGLVALFVALGGTSYAAVSLPKDSVGSAQIKARAVDSAELKSGAVTKNKIENNAVTSEKIAQGSIQAADIKAGVIPTVPSTSTPTDGSVTAAKLAKLPAVRVQPANATSLQSIPDGLTGSTLLNIGSTTQVNNDFTLGTGIEAGPPGSPLTPATTLKVPVSGVYNVSGGIRWAAAGTANGIRTLTLGTSTGAIPAGSTIPGATVALRQNIATSLYLTAGTELYLFVTQNSGAALDTSQSQGATFFAATLATP